MSYPNLPKSEYFQVFLAFRFCKASALLRPQHQKSNENLSLYRSKIFYRTDFWSIKAKTERILHGFASILTKSERKSVYKKHGSDNSFHPRFHYFSEKGRFYEKDKKDNCHFYGSLYVNGKLLNTCFCRGH